LNQLGFAMRTPTTRQKHSRTVTRYQTDLTDTDWRVIAPHLPKPCATGRPREWPMRELVNGIFYVMRAGCPWRLVPSASSPMRGYAGERVAGATSVALEIVRKAPDQIGLNVQPRRWVVERFFAWIGRNRRLAKHFEATIASARPSSTPPRSCSSCAASHDQHEFQNGL
jgi:transposase